jgi:hypothetical protein
VSPQGARKSVKKLLDAGILIKYDESKWRQIYVAKPILDAIQSPT